MAYPGAIKEALRAELESIRGDGLYKEERFIHSAQSSRIEVEYPAGSEVKEVINLCSNNYLGLSSHPEVVAAAHEGLDDARAGAGADDWRLVDCRREPGTRSVDRIAGRAPRRKLRDHATRPRNVVHNCGRGNAF